MGHDEGRIARDVIQLPPDFPFATGVIHDTISPEFQRIHWHNCLEINFIKEGTSRILINHDSMKVQAGDIVLIGSYDLHRHFSTKGLVMQTVTFEPQLLSLEERYDLEVLAPFRALGLRFSHLLQRSNKMIGELQAILDTIQAEYTGQAASYQTVIRAELLRFLAFINRYFANPEATGGLSLSRYQWPIRNVVAMMETRLDHGWTLKELAQCAHLSPSRFSVLFRDLMGMSPLEYLIHLRIAKAVSLLRETDKKVVDIALECGFRNLSNFRRLFHKHVGKSPRDIR